MYINEVKNIVESRGGRCISKLCKTIKTKVTVSCSEGHIWSPMMYDLKRGKWCRKCLSISQRKIIEDAKNLANKNDGICLSDNYINNHSKLKWKCENGHIFYSSYNKVYIGRWCATCSKKKKHTLEFVKNIAVERGGKCLSKKYVNVKTKMLFECSKGHQWYSIFGNVKNHNRWCKICSIEKRKKYTITDAQNIAISRGGECLSKEYGNFATKLKWKCKNRHIWSASLGSIKSAGTWCGKCGLTSQNKLTNIIRELFGMENVKDNYRELDWLVNPKTGNKMEIDIFVNKSNFCLAIEYDGQGHYFPVNFGGCSDKKAKKIFNGVVERDKIKTNLINNSGIDYFVRFKYDEPISDLGYVRDKLIKSGVIKWH